MLILFVVNLQAYIIDDDLIISGANLSQEYFTDRHDRYIIFSNGQFIFVAFIYLSQCTVRLTFNIE